MSPFCSSWETVPWGVAMAKDTVLWEGELLMHGVWLKLGIENPLFLLLSRTHTLSPEVLSQELDKEVSHGQ